MFSGGEGGEEVIGGWSTKRTAGGGCIVYILGWCDLALLAVFENGRIAANQVYFVYSIEKIGKFDRVQHTPRKALIFTKSQTPY